MVDPTGGHAFPTDTDRANRGVEPGMTLRDAFAMHILTGMLAHGWTVTDAIDIAFEAADVAILRREKIPKAS